MGKTYYPLKSVKSGYIQRGTASWYGPGFHGKKTANGETYDMHAMTAAHNILPLGCLVKVCNLKNNKEAIVRINDRGPFIDDRVIDLSHASARELGMLGPGTAPVEIEVVDGAKTMLASRKKPDSPPIVEKKGPNPFFAGRYLTLTALWR